MGTRQSGEMIGDFLLDGDVKLLEEASRCMKELRESPALQEERACVEREAMAHYQEKLQRIALN